jgi:hypothetical protein
VLKVEEGLDAVGDEILRVKDIVEAFGCLQTLLSDEVLLVVHTHEDS